MNQFARRVVRPVLVSFAVATSAICQRSVPLECSSGWASTGGLPGINSYVFVTESYDPDGSGPLTPRVVVGGGFSIAGSVLANNLAAWDPATRTWSPLGAGVNGSVFAVTTLPNGDLVAAGEFTVAGGVAANYVARWNGSSWSPLGSGANGPVFALTTLPSGDLVAGGSFTAAGGVAANNIARWNGSSWSPLGSGLSWGAAVLVALPNGDVVVGGRFATAGGMTVNGIARWDGSSWSPMGSGVAGGFITGVWALTALANGDVVAGGDFTTAGGVAANNVARWNGHSWWALSSGTDADVTGLAVLGNGDVVAAGAFTMAGGISAMGIARWDGGRWSTIGSGMDNFVRSLSVLPNGDLIAGGIFKSAGGLAAERVARWDGSSWSALGSGLNWNVSALITLPGGDLVASGSFTMAGGVAANRIARWDGSSWSPLGLGVGGSTNGNLSVVAAVARTPNGDLVAGGRFATAGGVAANHIARWDGASWAAFGSGMSGGVSEPFVAVVTALPGGEVVAGGHFATAGGQVANHIARWDGSAWSVLGSGMSSGVGVYASVNAVSVLPNGDLIAAGDFTSAGGVAASNIARWDGSNWSPLGSGMDSHVNSLVLMPNGDLIAGGLFRTAGGIAADRVARWDGSTWSPLGSGLGPGPGEVHALTILPNGDLVAGGHFPGTSGRHIARWDGTSWSAIGAGTDNYVSALATLPNGDLMVGGAFQVAGDLVSAYLARITPTCPATAAITGPGCPGGGGNNLYRPLNLPWAGSTYRAHGSGIASPSLVGVVVGLATTSIPLSVFGPSPVGCDLLVLPDVALPAVSQGGTVETSLPIPRSPSLAGLSLHQQLIVLELDGQFRLVQSTSTNRVSLRVGVL